MKHYQVAGKIAIVANGGIHNFKEISKLVKTHSFFVAVDGGLLNCEAMGIMPNLIVGDMDSTPPKALKKYKHIPIETFAIDKDKTDLEIAIELVYSDKVEKISLFAALEKRTDHALYNLHLLFRYAGKLVIETEYETIFVINQSMEISCLPGQKISLLPLGPPAIDVITKGLKWELQKATFNHHFMSVSNICLNETFKIEIKEGNLLCCLSRNSSEI